MSAESFAIVDDKHSILFSDLTQIINKTAYYYSANGVNPKDNIAILGHNSIEYVIAIYALWKLGAIPVPINTRLKLEEIKSILKSSNCNLILTDNDFSNLRVNITSIKLLVKFEGEEYKNSSDVEPNDTAVIIHTSGSSGIPKGVKITNSNLYQSYLLTQKSFNFSNEDRFLASLPFYHIGGFSIINRAFLSGGTLVIPKSIQQDGIVESISKYNPSIVSLVPTMLKRLIEADVKPNSELRHLFLGGGPSDDDLIASSFLNNWQVVKVYGSSETTAMVTACWGDELRKNPASAGKPFENIKIKILDETSKSVSPNIVGEVAISSATIANGYFNDSVLWKQKIHNNLYLTGDYGFLDNDGMLFVVARRTDLIVSGGENIDPREIEKILVEHTEISESFIFPVDNSEWGQIPVALIVLENSSLLLEKDIVKYLKSKIASYKIPKKIIFTDIIPKSELGKVNINDVKVLLQSSL